MSRLTIQERNRRARERYRAKKGLQLADTPIGRTGDEKMTNWRRPHGGKNERIIAVWDRFYRPVRNQTHFIYYPPEPGKYGVLNIQIALRDYTEEKFIALIKRHLKFDKYILHTDFVKNGVDAILYDFNCRLPERPTEEKVREIYRAFC